MADSTENIAGPSSKQIKTALSVDVYNKELDCFPHTLAKGTPVTDNEPLKTQLIAEALKALERPGHFGYVLCLYILSQWPDLDPTFLSSQKSPMNPASVVSTNPAARIEAALEHLKERAQASAVDDNTEVTKNLALKYIGHFNLSAYWSLLCAYSASLYYRLNPLATKPNDYQASQKVSVLQACWQFCNTSAPAAALSEPIDGGASTASASSDGGQTSTLSAPERSQRSLLKWQIFHATTAITQHKKISRDLTHWFFVIIAALYSVACGTTIAGAVIVLFGTAGLALPIAIASGLLTWWVNWRNGKSRIPAIMEELFYMPIPPSAKPGFLARRIPGTFYYVDETTNTTKSFNSKQLFFVWLGIFGAIGVGLAIGALTWHFTTELAVSLGFASAAFFPPILIIIVAVTVLAEIGLQLKSFIDVVRWDLLVERKKQFDAMLEGKGRGTKWIAYGVGITTLLVCTLALFMLAWAGQQATVYAFEGLFPKALASTLYIVSIVIAVFHFLGTIPFNIDMTITATNAGAQALTKQAKPSSKNASRSKPSRWQRCCKFVSHFFYRYKSAFFLGFVITFALTAGILSLGAGNLVGLPLLVFLAKSCGVGVGGGILACLFHRHELNLKSDPETNPPFFAAVGNGALNGFMAQSSRVSTGVNIMGIVSNAIMSIVASFAGYNNPKSTFLQMEEEARDSKIGGTIQQDLGDLPSEHDAVNMIRVIAPLPPAAERPRSTSAPLFRMHHDLTDNQPLTGARRTSSNTH